MKGMAKIGGMAALALILAAAAPAAAAGLAPWRHGTLDAKSDAGILFMVGQGFAEKRGLKLEIVQFHNDIVEVQALLAGDIDSYEASPGSAILAASRGADVKIIGCPGRGFRTRSSSAPTSGRSRISRARPSRFPHPAACPTSSPAPC